LEADVTIQKVFAMVQLKTEGMVSAEDVRMFLNDLEKEEGHKVLSYTALKAVTLSYSFVSGSILGCLGII
jgi:hypothetical protein